MTEDGIAFERVRVLPLTDTTVVPDGTPAPASPVTVHPTATEDGTVPALSVTVAVPVDVIDRLALQVAFG
ncbi:MAG: hypothetical protein P4L86_15995, partial [Mycobacterium sp.]|nr:hypothetical protein [Mycobacterium sp.]